MNDLIKLTNTPFSIEFDGKSYQIRKASLEQVITYTKRIEQLSADKVGFNESWMRMVAYAVWLMLSPQIEGLTEDYVSKNMPGGIDPTELLTQLGFISPKRASAVAAVVAKQTSNSSSPQSPSEQAGPQP
jgi:hypothetical protein